MKSVFTLNVNGNDYEVAVPASTTLVDVLREELRLTGTKIGCDEGDCGACSVLCDGKIIASCSTLAIDCVGKKIVTIEGLMKDGNLHPVQQAFIDCFALQCGFCTPGMILATVALLNENPDPTEYEIRDYLRGNICRCTGYVKIIDAVNEAKKMISSQNN